MVERLVRSKFIAITNLDPCWHFLTSTSCSFFSSWSQSLVLLLFWPFFTLTAQSFLCSLSNEGLKNNRTHGILKSCPVSSCCPNGLHQSVTCLRTNHAMFVSVVWYWTVRRGMLFPHWTETCVHGACGWESLLFLLYDWGTALCGHLGSRKLRKWKKGIIKYQSTYIFLCLDRERF